MGSTGQEAEKSKSRFARAAAGGKESTGSEGTKMSKEIVRQLADLTVLMSSYRRDLDRQQQVIKTLKGSHKPQESGTSHLHHIRPERRGRERTVLSRSPLRISANQPDWAVVPFATEEDTEYAADLEPETPVETVEKGATGPANVKPLRSTEIRRRRLEPWEGQSASSPMDGTEWTCTWPSD